MNTDIYNSINAEYAQKRIAAEILRENREKEVEERIPEFAQINSQIESAGFEAVHNILNSKDATQKNNTTAMLQQKIADLSEKKKKLLLEAGYPSDYMENVYECCKCKDRGTIESEGRVTACTCYMQRLIDLAQSASGLGANEMYSLETFDFTLFDDTVDEERYGMAISPRDNIIKIKERVVRYCDTAFSKPGEKNLLFTGHIGAGKTFLSKCLGRMLINKGYSVFYVSAPEMFDVINESKIGFDSVDSSVKDRLSLLKDVDCLIIDDLGTETFSEAKLSALLTLLNYRFEKDKAGEKPFKMIISTNIPAEKLHEMYDDSIASRIWGNFYMYRFAGNDLRLK